jgi:Flp pilus assembly protein CpaB
MPTLSKNIIISVVLALAAAIALVLYVGEIRSQAVTNERTVAVVVATADIAPGTSVADAEKAGAFSLQPMRASDVPAYAVTSVASIRGEIVTQQLYRGDTVTTTRIGTANGQSPSYLVKGYQRLLRLPLYQTQGLLPDVATGDKVDIWAKVANADATAFSERLIVPGAVVKQIDPADGQNASSQGSLLLLMTDRQAGAVAAALSADSSGQSDNNIWLVLAGHSGAKYHLGTAIPISR